MSIRQINFGMIAAACTISGCADPRQDTYLVDVRQSATGNVIAFSTHADEAVWAVDSKKLVKCGTAPFAIDPSGTRVYAKDDKDASVRVVQLIDPEPIGSSIRIDKCLPGNATWTLDGIRCGIGQAIAQFFRIENGKRLQAWIRIDPVRHDCETADHESWCALSECESTSFTYRESRGTEVREYATKSGMTLVQRTPKSGRGTISRGMEVGDLDVLLIEDHGRYLARRTSNAGFQYP